MTYYEADVRLAFKALFIHMKSVRQAGQPQRVDCLALLEDKRLWHPKASVTHFQLGNRTGIAATFDHLLGALPIALRRWCFTPKLVLSMHCSRQFMATNYQDLVSLCYHTARFTRDLFVLLYFANNKPPV